MRLYPAPSSYHDGLIHTICLALSQWRHTVTTRHVINQYTNQRSTYNLNDFSVQPVEESAFLELASTATQGHTIDNQYVFPLTRLRFLSESCCHFYYLCTVCLYAAPSSYLDGLIYTIYLALMMSSAQVVEMSVNANSINLVESYFSELLSQTTEFKR